MNQHGGSREGAGRPTGSGTLSSTEQRQNIAAIARTHSEQAINTLHGLMMSAERETTRLAAAAAILDRAYGKPSQQIALMDFEERNKSLGEMFDLSKL